MLNVTIQAISVPISVGIFFAYFPLRKAVRMNPIALRYEQKGTSLHAEKIPAPLCFRNYSTSTTSISKIKSFPASS